MNHKTAQAIVDLADEYEVMKKEKSARAIGIKHDLRNACLDALVKETIDHAREVLSENAQA